MGGGAGEEMAGRAVTTAVAAGKEKSSFAVTCSLLSQYLKERKGGLQGLALDMAPPPAAARGGLSSPPTTMNLLSGLDTPGGEEASSEPRPSGAAVAVELSLEKPGTETPRMGAPADTQNSNENTREAEEAQQLTIFYGGKVVVFDNFPSTKVKDLLQMVNAGDGAGNASSNAATQSVPRPAQDNLSDLPIARRNSLHRFLEKRKGRVIAKAPYQVRFPVDAPRKDAGHKSWLGLAQEVTIKQEI